jgi:hypothetical protein
MGHSVSYEIPMRYGAENIHPARRLPFRDIAGTRSNGLDPLVLYHSG